MKSHKPAALAANILNYAVLIVGAFFTLLPFLWMISSSFKTPAEIIKIPPVLVPAVPQWQNYLAAWTAAPFGRYLINTIIITFFTNNRGADHLGTVRPLHFRGSNSRARILSFPCLWQP